MESATFTHQIVYQADRREYAHATWFCFSDGEVQESFHRACSCSFSRHYNDALPTLTEPVDVEDVLMMIWLEVIF
jgi:hypothetical protein